MNKEERKFVNEDKISKYLKCSMCLSVFKNPIRTKCEYKIFINLVIYFVDNVYING